MMLITFFLSGAIKTVYIVSEVLPTIDYEKQKKTGIITLFMTAGFMTL